MVTKYTAMRNINLQIYKNVLGQYKEYVKDDPFRNNRTNEEIKLIVSDAFEGHYRELKGGFVRLRLNFLVPESMERTREYLLGVSPSSRSQKKHEVKFLRPTPAGS